jgi:hypothetical protein
MDIESRVQLIEREVAVLRSRTRRLRVVAATASALCGALLLGAASADAPSEVLRARRFEIVSSDNRAVVILAVDAEGTGVVSTHDREGHPMVALRTGEHGDGALITYNRTGNQLVELSETMSGAGNVMIFDGAGVRLAAVTANRDGDGELRAYNRRGHLLGGLRGTLDAGGALYLNDANGRDLIGLGLLASRVAAVRVYDGGGNPSVWIGNAPGEGGYVSAFSADGSAVRATWPAAAGAVPQPPAGAAPGR